MKILKYQVPTEHDGAERLHFDPLRAIEPHKGFVAAHARLC